MRIGTYNSVVNSTRHLEQTSRAIGLVLQRLSSGKRFSSAYESPGDFSIALSLESKSRTLKQIQLSHNIANSILSAADAAIGNQIFLVQRMRELAVQAANGTMGTHERGYLDEEFASLLKEFERITDQTEFNGTKLLDGSFGTRSLLSASGSEMIPIEIGDLRASQIFQKTIGSGAFRLANTYETGSSNAIAQSLRILDVDSDGHLDSVSASYDGFIVVRLGNGDGSFGDHAMQLTTNGVTALEMADLNQDGHQDILVGTGDSIQALFNDGAGNFSPPEVIAFSNQIFGLTTGDINGDGVLDLISTEGANDNILVQFGLGDGNFVAPAHLDSATGPNAARLSDLDKDGDLDLVVQAQTDSVTNIYLNDGAGNFSPRTTHWSSAGEGGRQIELQDINEDGHADLIVAGELGNVFISMGLGDGSFDNAVSYSAGARNSALQLGDMDNDGILDIVTASADDGRLNILLGNGDGSFQDPSSFQFTSASNGLSSYFIGLDLADLNEDGVLDISVASPEDDVFKTYLSTTIDVAALDALKIKTQDSAQDLLEILDAALENLIAERSAIGAGVSVLRHEAHLSSHSIETAENALSQISDADYAEETLKLVRLQVLQQAQIGATLQGQRQLQIILELLP